tara:strand:- start:14526 stop:15167 length:642 start_codon:yes stop_codon:yes gene_type:complete
MNKNLSIRSITKEQSKYILKSHHYLSKVNKGFRSGYNFGLFEYDNLIGVCIFHSPSVPETVKGCFGLSRENQKGVYELGRLCLIPESTQKNLLSWFVSKSIKLLRKQTNVRSILSYADSSLHTGFIYQATNFNYYGLTAPKKDFWFELTGGSFVKHQRGPVKGKKGEWRVRDRKHRYLLVFDKELVCLWKKQPYPKNKNIAPLNKKPTTMCGS